MSLRDYLSSMNPARVFHRPNYLRHNARRLEHLASLDLSLAGRTVLEVGAGIGDHTSFYLDRGCQVTVTEAREENLKVLRRIFSDRVYKLDLDAPHLDRGPFEICHCYGLLYHLNRPDVAIRFLAEKVTGLLVLETCVSFGDGLELNIVPEAVRDPSQATSGSGCRPTRAWVVAELSKYFGHVYVTKTQPFHEQFPIDWKSPDKHTEVLSRAVFVASKTNLDHNTKLSRSLLDQQTR